MLVPRGGPYLEQIGVDIVVCLKKKPIPILFILIKLDWCKSKTLGHIMTFSYVIDPNPNLPHFLLESIRVGCPGPKT